MGVGAAAHRVPYPYQRQRYGRGFDPPGSTARTSPRHHQKSGEKEVRVGQRREVDGVKPGRAVVDRGEPCGQYLLVRTHRPERFGIVPLHGEEQRHPRNDQQERHVHDDFRMGRKACQLPLPVVADFEQNDISQPAQNDQNRDREVDNQIASIAHQVVAEKGKAGVVERRDGVKYSVPRGLAKGHIEPEPEREDHNPGRFDDDDGGKDDFQKPDQSVHTGVIERFLQNQTVAVADFLFAHDRQKGDRRHVSKPPDLDEGEYDGLSERGKIDGGVFDDQSGDAHGGRGGKEGIEKTELAVVGKRQRQQQCTKENQGDEAKENNLDFTGMRGRSFGEK